MAETFAHEHMLRAAVGTLLSLGLVAATNQTIENHTAVEVRAVDNPAVQRLGSLSAEACLLQVILPVKCEPLSEEWAKTTTTTAFVSTTTTLAPAVLQERRPRNRAHRTATSVVTTTTTPKAATDERIDLGIFESTCYALKGNTASGAPVGPETVAVDPRVIRLGTVLEVEGYGRAVARDTGGDIKGRRIDVWKPSAADCINNWGRRSVRVWRIT